MRSIAEGFRLKGKGTSSGNNLGEFGEWRVYPECGEIIQSPNGLLIPYDPLKDLVV